MSHDQQAKAEKYNIFPPCDQYPLFSSRMLSKMSTSSKIKRKVLTLKEKVNILKLVEANVKSKSQIAKESGIPLSTLSTFLKHKETIQKAYNNVQGCTKRKTVREATYPKLEEALNLWLQKARSQNLPISGPLLTEKARQLGDRLNIEDFKFSTGWLARFKKRNSLVFRKVCGESSSVDLKDVEQWLENTLQPILQKYEPQNIFNADETGLFFRLLPDKTLTFKDDNCKGGKRSKERITVLLTSNMDGSEKLDLLVVGKSKKPRCFRGIKKLPVDYEANKKAWITSIIFEKWVRKLDRKFSLANRKIVLFIDNCTAHIEVKNLKAIRLEFFPANCTSVLQALDQGVINALKGNYRRSLLNRILLCMDCDKDYSVNLLSAIQLLANAWKELKKETISNCIQHAGFKLDQQTTDSESSDTEDNEDETEDETDADLITNLQEKGYPIPANFDMDMYVQADKAVVISEELDDNAIVEAVLDKDSDQETDEPDSPEVPIPSIKEVTTALDVLKRFASAKCETGNFFSSLLAFEQFVGKVSRD